MKKIFLTLTCVCMALVAMAQMNVWYNGELIYQRDYTEIDSITFGEVPDVHDTIVPVEPDTTLIPELPIIANPGPGYTTIAIYAEICPRGCYLVGTTNDWNEWNDAYSFESIPGAENWYALTVPYEADFQGKVIARPSDPDVPMGWSYQWGRNNDPYEDDYYSYCRDVMPEAGHDNVILLSYGGEFEYENCGQPKLINIQDDGVVYIRIKNWAVSPIIEPVPLETCWAKSNWDGDNWYWKQMTAVGDGVFELYTRWWGNGMNISEENSDIVAAWYADPVLIDNPLAGDSVLVTFVSRKRTTGDLSIRLIEAIERPEVVFKDITITATVPTWWNYCYVWAWYTEYDYSTTSVFDTWPGQQLNIVNGQVSYTFEQVGTPLNVIFNNGAGEQTVSIEGITDDTHINISDNIW